MIRLKSIGEYSLRFAAILLASAIFFIDVLYPGFNTGGILYQSLFILSLWIPSRQNNLLLAGLCTLYICGGYWWRHAFFLESHDLFSRSISLLGIWSITVVTSKREKLLLSISDRERRLKSLIEERTIEDRELYTRKTQSLQTQLNQLGEKANNLLQSENVHRQARESAEAASKMSVEFLNNLGHKIQAPLEGVINLSQMLSDTALDSVQRDHVFSIRSAGESMLMITNDILDYSKIENGDIDLEFHPFILRHCIEDAFDAIANRVVQKNIELAYSLDPAIPVTIISDKKRVHQILINLLGNAVQRTEEGEIIISAKLLEKNEGQYLVYFSVQDSGAPMLPAKIEQLFKTGSDEPAGPAPNIEAANLGLSISARLTHLLKGKIWAENKEDKGALFQLALPFEKASRQDIPLQGKPWFIGKHALVVDDNEHMCRFLNHQLKNWGMQATVFNNGPEAIRWYSAGHVCDFAIIDLEMPVLDGLTLAHQIRQNNDDLPILLMTMLGNSVSDPALTSTITKPIKQQRLYEHVNAILSLKSTTEAEYVEIKVKSR